MWVNQEKFNKLEHRVWNLEADNKYTFVNSTEEIGPEKYLANNWESLPIRTVLVAVLKHLKIKLFHTAATPRELTIIEDK